jgi:hypothetical protein
MKPSNEKTREASRRYYAKHRDARLVYKRKWAKEHKDEQKNRNLKWNYGISREEYDTLLESQGGCCAICGKEGNPDGQMMSVDHDHKTGKIRGILCRNCNLGIGYLEDNKETLLSAIGYLERAK